MRSGAFVSILELALLALVFAPQLRADEIHNLISTPKVTSTVNFTLSGVSTSDYRNDVLLNTHETSSFPRFRFGKNSSLLSAAGINIQHDSICVFPVPTSTPEPSTLLLLSGGLFVLLASSAIKKRFVSLLKAFAQRSAYWSWIASRAN